jgi:transposase
MAKSLFWLSEEAWKALSPHLPRGRPGKPRVDDRTVISGILHVLKTGCRWRDAPPVYGPPTTIYNRYNRWSQRRVWQRIFERMAAAGPIPDELSIDSSHVKAHRSASGSKRGSLKKRSAARGAEGRARSMLWPMIAADRSLSR